MHELKKEHSDSLNIPAEVALSKKKKKKKESLKSRSLRYEYK